MCLFFSLSSPLLPYLLFSSVFMPFSYTCFGYKLKEDDIPCTFHRLPVCLPAKLSKGKTSSPHPILLVFLEFRHYKFLTSTRTHARRSFSNC
ncbi:hypothetical protein F4809DRAFT_166337 [Biscogniauxia mediterranea]|nr:hypothetical protein F4809DRAFT_166337 [Biscogniauxia mediterranea]